MAVKPPPEFWKWAGEFVLPPRKPQGYAANYERIRLAAILNKVWYWSQREAKNGNA